MSKIQEILDRPLDLLWLKTSLFDPKSRFNKTEFLEKFQLSHTHPLIARAASWGNFIKYGEIGSHIGRSMMCVALLNPAANICCFDKPDGGWGGETGTDEELKKNAEKFASGRHQLFFGSSDSGKIKNSIKENGPYDIFLVDGDHRAEPAMKDLEFVYPHIKNGGILIFDDLTHHTYLEQVWDEFVSSVNPSESRKIMEITKEEDDLNYVRRGIGILVK